MHDHRLVRALLPLLLATLAGCSAEQSTPASASNAAAAATPPGATTGSRAQDPSQWLPAAHGDTLPRTLSGFTLLDPAPAGSEPVKGVVFKAARAATFNRDDGYIRVLSFDDRIFRIEHTLPEGIEFAPVAAAARTAYGAADDESASNVRFGRSMKVGATMLEVRTVGDRVQVFIEDAGTVVKVHSAR